MRRLGRRDRPSHGGAEVDVAQVALGSGERELVGVVVELFGGVPQNDPGIGEVARRNRARRRGGARRRGDAATGGAAAL